ncbi:MAG: hypothetical protein H0V80_00330 [Acidobacteria bacterium]|nr:hypothetical protein [Acidobacteriota bacterium]
MSEARIDRLLAAAIHQAIADLLPDRLDFYESYLRPRGWREDAVNLAPVSAVLSFLRHEENGTYDAVMIRAATYAADWWLAAQSWPLRRAGRITPQWYRVRQFARLSHQHFEQSYRGTKAKVRIDGMQIDIEVRGSIFCSTREPTDHPHCRYYLAFAEALFERDGVASRGQLTSCRALGADACGLRLRLGPEAA